MTPEIAHAKKDMRLMYAYDSLNQKNDRIKMSKEHFHAS